MIIMFDMEGLRMTGVRLAAATFGFTVQGLGCFVHAMILAGT